MTKNTKKQTRIIVAQSAEEFEDKINKVLELISEDDSNYQLTFNTSLGFCAYVVFNKIEYQADDVRDEYELANEIHTCKECIYYTKSTDRRIKNVRCAHNSKLKCDDTPCCLDFYESLEKINTFLKGEDDGTNQGE